MRRMYIFGRLCLRFFISCFPNGPPVGIQDQSQSQSASQLFMSLLRFAGRIDLQPCADAMYIHCARGECRVSCPFRFFDFHCMGNWSTNFEAQMLCPVSGRF